MLMKMEQSHADRLAFLASGKLTDNDYQNFLVPAVREALQQYPRIRLMFLLDGFRGWELKAALEELSFGLEINPRIEYVAVVGDQRWEKWIARLTGLVSKGELRYFDLSQADQAWQWLCQASGAVADTA
jgi:hypothetical protein